MKSLPRPPSHKVELEALGHGIFAVACFALTLPAIKFLLPHLSPIQIGLFRSTLAGLVALPMLLISKPKGLQRAQFFRLLLMAACVVFGFPILSALGLVALPASHGGVVLAVIPLSTAIFASILTRQKPPLLFWCAAVAGFVLLVLFSLLRSKEGKAFSLSPGDLLLLAAGILVSFGYAQGGLLSKERSGREIMCWLLVLSLPLLLPLSLFNFHPADFQSFGLIQWISLGFLVFLNSLFAFFSWNRALALGGIQKISQLQLLQPFFTYLASLLLLGEHFDIFAFCICLAVIGLIFIARRAMNEAADRPS